MFFSYSFWKSLSTRFGCLLFININTNTKKPDSWFENNFVMSYDFHHSFIHLFLFELFSFIFDNWSEVECCIHSTHTRTLTLSGSCLMRQSKRKLFLSRAQIIFAAVFHYEKKRKRKKECVLYVIKLLVTE